MGIRHQGHVPMQRPSTRESLSAATEHMMKTCCASCGKSEYAEGIGKLKTCTACKSVKYCSVDCQRNHRKAHKKECKRIEKELLEDKRLSKVTITKSGKERAADIMSEEKPIPVNDLPPCHLFRLIYRIRGGADGEKQIDWPAVLSRLDSKEGREECRQWVKTDKYAHTLFLHEFCGLEFRMSEVGSCVDSKTGLLVLKKAIEAYPESVGLSDCDGSYPLHILCDRRCYYRNPTHSAVLYWSDAITEGIMILIKKYPEALTTVTSRGHRYSPDNTTGPLYSSRKTVLHCLLNSIVGEYQVSQSRDTIVRRIVQICPDLAKTPDSGGFYPLHCAARTCQQKGLSFFALKEIFEAFPEAINIRCMVDGRIPAMMFLTECDGNRFIGRHDQSVFDLLSSNQTASNLLQDSSDFLEIIGPEQDSFNPTGDILDYICVKYMCNLRGIEFTEHGEHDDKYQHDIDNSFFPEFIPANESFLLFFQEKTLEIPNMIYRRRWEDEDLDEFEFEFYIIPNLERMWSSLLKLISRADNREPASTSSPLHAFCRGQLCRPWYFAITHLILRRFPGCAEERDKDGNLALHLFLKSCMLEQRRAIGKGYAKDEKEYRKAVKLCFRLLLDANRNAPRVPDADSSFPLLLAIKHCPDIAFDDIMEPLLDESPRSLLSRDIETHLHPFASAAVGGTANLDTSFVLLRRDPSVLACLGFGG